MMTALSSWLVDLFESRGRRLSASFFFLVQRLFVYIAYETGTSDSSSDLLFFFIALSVALVFHRQVMSVSIKRDRATGKNLGYGFVKLSSHQEARAAKEAMQVRLHVQTAVPLRAALGTLKYFFLFSGKLGAKQPA